MDLINVVLNAIPSGKIFSVTWIKKNGEVRKACVKKCVWENTSSRTRKHDARFITLVDMNKLQKKGNGYVLINKRSILKVQSCGLVHINLNKCKKAVSLGLMQSVSEVY